MSTPLAVLLLEDSEDDALLNLRALKGKGYAPTWARVETGEELGAALAERTWDILLCDHNLPNFNAIAALRLLNERGVDLPCIVVSGSIGEQQVIEAMREGAQDYVIKQDLSRLASAVPRALAAASERRERRRAELLLRESEERYALAVLGSRDGIWDWNVATGGFYSSDRIKEIFDVDWLEDTILAFSRQIHEEDRPRVRRAMADHLETRAPLDVEYRIVVGTGEVRWISVRGQALWGEDGKASRVAGSLSDITTRKLADEVLRQKIEIIERQAEAIRTLSTPIIEVWDDVLMMPVFGVIDGERAAQMMEVLLEAVARRRCRNAIIDLTAVKAIDADTADHVLRLVRAVELIGARGIVVGGIRPEVAQIMVTIGADLQRITTLATLRDALLLCMRGGRKGARARR